MSLCDLREQHSELYEQVERVADHRTVPFCYSCYIDAPSGRCVRCGNDDLMRHLSGVGVEYCYDWVIEHLLRQEVEEIDEEQQEELYMQMLDDSYGDEVKVGFLTVNTGRAVKDLDPIAFQQALNDYFLDDEYIEVSGRLFLVHSIEEWVEKQEVPETDNGREEAPA